jgi:hypothetical protein
MKQLDQACNALLQIPTDEVLHLHDAHQPQHPATRLIQQITSMKL